MTDNETELLGRRRLISATTPAQGAVQQDSMNRFEPGAVRPGLLDVLTALILLAILLWASWKQFPAYDRNFRQPMPPVRALQRSGNF